MQTQPLPNSTKMPNFCVLGSCRLQVSRKGRNITVNPSQQRLPMSTSAVCTCEVGRDVNSVCKPKTEAGSVLFIRFCAYALTVLCFLIVAYEDGGHGAPDEGLVSRQLLPQSYVEMRAHQYAEDQDTPPHDGVPRWRPVQEPPVQCQ